jgi:UPF0271 protein
VQKKFELNCDMGEGIGNEHLLMPLIDSCSIACGGHAGDDDTMKQTIELALKYKVSIGAHPSFPDKANFGRKKLNMDRGALMESLNNQVSHFESLCLQQGAALSHIKTHGALYNLAAVDVKMAQTVIDALQSYLYLSFVAPGHSVFQKLIHAAGGSIKTEAFADRSYHPDLTLVSRDDPNGVITNPEKAMEQVKEMVINQRVRSISGSYVPITAETFCVHGDNPSAMKVLQALRNLLI